MIATTLTTVNVNIIRDRCQSGPIDVLVAISFTEILLMILLPWRDSTRVRLHDRRCGKLMDGSASSK